MESNFGTGVRHLSAPHVICCHEHAHQPAAARGAPTTTPLRRAQVVGRNENNGRLVRQLVHPERPALRALVGNLGVIRFSRCGMKVESERGP